MEKCHMCNFIKFAILCTWSGKWRLSKCQIMCVSGQVKPMSGSFMCFYHSIHMLLSKFKSLGKGTQKWWYYCYIYIVKLSHRTRREPKTMVAGFCLLAVSLCWDEKSKRGYETTRDCHMAPNFGIHSLFRGGNGSGAKHRPITSETEKPIPVVNPGHVI